MKTCLFFWLMLLITMPGWAQIKVVLLRDTTRLNLSPAALERTYPPAFAKAAGQPGVFARRGQTFFDSVNARHKQFSQFIERNKRRLPVKGVAVETREFIHPDGTYERIFCSFQSDTLTTEQETALILLMADWYGQHPFPLKTKTGFYWRNFTQIGAIPQKRTVRRGAGIISTVAAAERTNRPDTVTTLAFNQLGLSTVPEVVYRFPHLQELDLSKNDLHELPARLTADLPSLKRVSLLYNHIPDDSVFFTSNKHLVALNLQGNKLTRVPGFIRRNHRLESLWLGNNDLKNLDVNPIRRLRRLNDLNLYNAGLTTLPKQIGRLKRLKVLDLYYNKFTQLPRRLGRMKRLEQLALAYNDLSQLPVSVTKLRRLQVLYVHHNRISQLPAELQRLRELRVLDLGYNWFTVPPAVLASLPALEELDLSNNNVQELPPSLGSLRGLKKLYIRSNPLTRTDAKAGPYAPVIQQLEANSTEVFY